jgi:hypothetical protein
VRRTLLNVHVAGNTLQATWMTRLKDNASVAGKSSSIGAEMLTDRRCITLSVNAVGKAFCGLLNSP